MSTPKSNQAPTAPAWRADIDGLRALAVLPVVLFHAGVAGFDGGFVGVDIFFVISGFLITGILLRELDAGRFSLARFYVRRARRLFPALALSCVLTALGAFALLPPAHFVDVGEALQHVATFTANHHFFAVRNDYWDQNTLRSQPLLHMWSLAVEEQFYVVLPLLLMLVYRVRSGAVRPVLWLLAALSFLGSEWAVRAAPSWAFYLLPSRAWELLLGSMLAVRARSGVVLPESLRGPAAWSGLLMVVASVLLLEEGGHFPGAGALAPTLGAALLLAAGAGSGEGPAVVRALRLRPLVVVGQISYSLYLIHWPLFVLARSVGWTARGLPDLPASALITAAIALSWMSWRWAEGPFRHGRADERPWPVLRAALLGLVVLFISGSVVLRIGRRGWPFAQPLPVAVRVLGTDTHRSPGIRCEGAADVARIAEDGGGCVVGEDGPPSVALFGDSHARMWTAAVEHIVADGGPATVILARSSCTPLPGVVPRTRPLCEQLTEATFQYLERSPVRTVILAGYWVDIAESIPGGDLVGPMRAAVGRLRRAGKDVVVLFDPPRLSADDDALNSGAISIREGGAKVRRRDAVGAEDAARLDKLRRALREDAVRVLDPWDHLCTDAGCLVAAGGRTWYRDRQHLNDEGAAQLRAVIAPAFAPGAQR